MNEKWYLGIRENLQVWSGNSVEVEVEINPEGKDIKPDQVIITLKENYQNADPYTGKLKKDFLAREGERFLAEGRYEEQNLAAIVNSGSTKGIVQSCHLTRILDQQLYVGELLSRGE